ncbi:MAG: energy-coupling factor transporter transmembrane protein EcfT [Oscillibacter sp.]|nr:energy-coupling factor transporter transmembrane protein EcfT [Oscillibacter sp.]
MKLLFIVVFCTVPLFFTRFSYLVVCAALAAPIWISAKIDPRPIKGLLVAILVFSVVAIIFPTFYNYDYPNKIILFRIGPLAATNVGFISGLMLAFRAAIPAVVALILICTTDPAALAKAMMKMKMPMSVSFMMMGALRMFPLVSEVMGNVRTAQLIRGVKSGGTKNAWHAFKLAVTPLMINSLRKSRTTGLAVESKGFGMHAWKEYYQEYKLHTMDYVMLIFCIAFVVAGIVLRYGFGLGVNPMVLQA